MPVTSHQHFQSELLRKLLLYRRITRRQIAEAFDLSMAAVTRHARWLTENDLVSSEFVRLPDTKRPVEVFRVSPRLATSLAVRVRPDRLTADLLRGDGSCFASFDLPVREATQAELLGALGRLTDRARSEAESHGRYLDVIGMSLRGYLEPLQGMIFDIHGIDHWEPCLPAQVLREFAGLPVHPWTTVATKAYGLMWNLQREDGVGCIEAACDHLGLASIANGNLRHGRVGTAGVHVHQQVCDDPERCYCGRSGCLDTQLRRGTADREMIRNALPAIIDELDVTHIGIDADSPEDLLAAARDQHGIREVRAVTDPEELERHGLAYACARAGIDLALNSVVPSRTRRAVNPAALRETLPTSTPKQPMRIKQFKETVR